MEIATERRAGPDVRPALLERTRAIARRTGRDLRDTLAMIGELERAAVIAVYVAAEDEITDEIADTVTELLRGAREQHPHQELSIVIFRAPEEAQRGDRNGRYTEHAQRE